MAVRPNTDMKSGAPRPETHEGELEQYGVWVKAEPQDIEPEPNAATESEGAESLLEDSFLTDEEERLLGSFDELEPEEEIQSSSPPSVTTDNGEDSFSSLPDIEDFSISAEEDLPSLKEDVVEENLPSLGEEEGIADISLEELETGSPPSSIGPDADIDMSSIVGLGDETPALKPQMEDVSAEFLDFEETAPNTEGTSPEPADALAIDDVTAEFLNDDSAASPPVVPVEPAPAPEEFEDLDIDLQFDDTLPSSEQSAEAGFEQISEFDDFLKDEPQVKAPVEPDFDDLGALERELSEPAESAESKTTQGERPSPVSEASASLSNELLLKIATELSSIRSELVSLKSQFGALKAQEAVEAAPEASESEAAAPGGFFDEEEDETIALTGDELDNILSSADFTEEAAPAEPEEEAAPAEEAAPEKKPELENILPESGDYSLAEESPIEEIRLGPAEEVAAPAIEDEARSGIDLLVEEGLPPLTEAPEDTSYLEEPLVAEEPLDLGETPTIEAPLVEPDLSELTLDEVDELEVAGELPVAEEEPLPDLTLETVPSPESLPEEPAEAEELEPLAPIPEIEEFSLDEISLAEEGEPSPLAEVEPEAIEEAEPVIELAEEELLPEAVQVVETEESAPPEAEAIGRSAEPESESFTVELEEEAPSNHPDDIPVQLDDSLFVAPPDEGEILSPSEEIHIPEVESFAASSIPVEEEIEIPSLEPETAETAEELAVEEEALITEEPAAEATEEVEAETPERDPSEHLKNEIRSVLSYLDKLLEALPEEKIEEFAHSEHFDTYKKLFEELGLV